MFLVQSLINGIILDLLKILGISLFVKTLFITSFQKFISLLLILQNILSFI